MDYSYSYKASSKIKVFISFDYDHDLDLKNLLIGQSKNDDSPFEMTDMSVKEELSGDWKEKAREKIKKVDQVVVICGEYTDSATGVSAEINLAREEDKPYFLLWGRNGNDCVKPKSAGNDDKIYNWTWDNLKKLLKGGR